MGKHVTECFTRLLHSRAEGVMCEGILHAPNVSPAIAPNIREPVPKRREPNTYFPSKAFGFNKNESQGLLTHIFVGNPGLKET